MTVFHRNETKQPLPEHLRGGVIAIGNFDGVHRGHQAVLAATLDRARAAGRPALALTFEPHPRSFFAPDRPVFRLTPPAAKARLAAALGLDGLVIATFCPTSAFTSCTWTTARAPGACRIRATSPACTRWSCG